MTMQEKTLSFEQLPGLIQNLGERIEALKRQFARNSNLSHSKES